MSKRKQIAELTEAVEDLRRELETVQRQMRYDRQEVAKLAQARIDRVEIVHESTAGWTWKLWPARPFAPSGHFGMSTVDMYETPEPYAEGVSGSYAGAVTSVLWEHARHHLRLPQEANETTTNGAIK